MNAIALDPLNEIIPPHQLGVVGVHVDVRRHQRTVFFKLSGAEILVKFRRILSKQAVISGTGVLRTDRCDQRRDAQCRRDDEE